MTATSGSSEPIPHLPADSYPSEPTARDSDRLFDPTEPAGSSSTATPRPHTSDSSDTDDQGTDGSNRSSGPVPGWTDAGATWDDPSTVFVLAAVALGVAGVLFSLLSIPGGAVALAASPPGVALLLTTALVVVFVYVVAPVAVDIADSAGYRMLRRTVGAVVLFGVLALGISLLASALPVALPVWAAAAVALAVGALVAMALVQPESPNRYSEYRLQTESYGVWIDDGKKELTNVTDCMDTTLREETALQRGDVERKIQIARRKLSLATAALDDGRPELFLTHYNSATRDIITIKLGLAALRRRLETSVSSADGDGHTDGDDLEAEFDAIKTELTRRLVRAAEVVLGTTPASPSSAATATPTSRRWVRSRSESTPATPTDSPVPDTEPVASRPFDWSQSLAQRFVFAAERDVDPESAAFIKHVLTRDGEIRSDLTDDALRAAAIRLHTHDERRFATLRTVERLLRLGSVLGVAGLVVFVLLAASGVTAGVLVPLAGISASVTLVLVALFGFFGAVTSSLFALKDLSADGFTNPEFASPVINREFMFMRFVVGTLMGVVSYVALSSGVLTVVLSADVAAVLTGSAFAALTVAFAAGFIERFVTNAVEQFAANATAESTASKPPEKNQ